MAGIQWDDPSNLPPGEGISDCHACHSQENIAKDYSGIKRAYTHNILWWELAQEVFTNVNDFQMWSGFCTNVGVSSARNTT